MPSRTKHARLLGPLLALLLAGPVGAGLAEGVRFFATGDVPYFDVAQPRYRELLALAANEDPDLLVHVGDIKRSSAPCSDEALGAIRDLFRDQSLPVLYTPGDNEWTDCHTEAAGGFDPKERLARLRELFFKDPAVLRLDRLGVEHQKAPYVENVRLLHREVLFVTLHVVGSHNNRRPKNAKAMAEFRERDAANRRFLKDAQRVARERRAKAVVVLFHADLRFERDSPEPAFRATQEGLRELVKGVSVPVLLVHGDSHEKRIDHPLTDAAGKPIERFTRLEVPGAPDVRGVLVEVRPQAAEPFVFRDLGVPSGLWPW